MDGRGTEQPKLGVLKSLMEGGCEARCLQVRRKGLRRILAKLRGGTAELRVETGRWVGLEREDRICGQCCSGEVENVEHFILRCGKLTREREVFVRRMEERVDGFDKRGDEEKVMLVLNEACKDGRAGRAVERMWERRFFVPDESKPSFQMCWYPLLIFADN